MNKLLKRKSFVILLICVAVLLIALTLDLCGRNIAGFAEGYSNTVYPVFMTAISFVSGMFPFALGEILLLLLALGIVFGIAFLAVKLIKGKGRRLCYLRNAGLILLCFASFMYFSYTVCCGINYNRTSFSKVSGLTTEKYTSDELTMLSLYLIDKANSAAEEITAQGSMGYLDKNQLEAECVKAMNRVGEEYPSLSGFYPRPKALVASEAMSHLRLLGIYNPFTVEANYNNNVPRFSIPFTVCHELSHLKGFMQEDEANYIAYLACRDSDNVYLRYSGYVQALNYTLGQLYAAIGADKYWIIYDTINPVIKEEFQNNNKYWSNYETKVAEVSGKVNDTYLRVQGVEDGAKSYGRFVDLMISDCKKENNEQN